MGLLRRDCVAGIAICLFAAVVAWESRRLPVGTLSNPGPAFMPLGLAALLGVLGAVVAIGSSATAALRWPEARHAAAILTGCAFAALALERLGYRVTMLAVLAFLLGVMERKPAWVVALVAIGLSFGSHFVFAHLLRVPLPVGPWGL